MKRIIAFAGVAATAVAFAGASAGGANATTPPSGKGVGGSYIVVMKADPLLRSTKQSDLRTSGAQSKRAALKASHDKVLEGAGIAVSRKVNTYTNALNGFSVLTDAKGAAALAKQPGVAAVLKDEMRQPTAIAAAVNEAKAAPSGVNDLQKFLGLDTGAYAKGIKGNGVIVGVIDTGIWPEHPMLRDNGTFPAAPTLDESERSACAFGNQAWNPNDKPFTCNNKLIGAREFLDVYKSQTGLEHDEFDSARDNEGHGTHTATTAAGNANVQSRIFGVNKDIVSGIAPRAQIIAYKALGDAGGYGSDLTAAIDQAVADGVDVINYSIGGGAEVVSADTLAFLFAADAGVFAAVSAGNDGPGPETVGGPANVPWVTGVGATTFPRNFAGRVKLGDGRIFKGTSVTKGTSVKPIIDGTHAGGTDSRYCVEGSLSAAKVRGKIVLCERGVNGRVAKSAEVKRAGGVGMVLFNSTDVDTMFSDNFFVPTVMMDYTNGARIRRYANNTPGATARITNMGMDTLWHYSPTVTYFSSRGPTVPNSDTIKPDISAPGAQIMAGNTPMPSGGSQPAGQLWQAIAGTSMSSPVVAGSYALLKQAHPEWSAAAAKSALMTQSYAAVRKNDRVTPADPFDTGSGMAKLGSPGAKSTSFQPGLVYDAGFYDYLGFLCDEGREAFANPDATCGALANAGYATTAENLNYPSIGMSAVPGKMTVKRTVTNVSSQAITATASVRAPQGYRVTVSPATITVAPGASKSFEVSVTNTGAPIGAWRFGSLTWQGSGYAVRSPIAVNATRIASPAEITGTGTSGQATITSTVGVAGTYTATAHGLVPAEHHNDTVAQDPDQTYPSPDDGAGVDRIPYTLNGVDHARWKLDIGGDVDLDIYLLDSSGKVVAQSTNGGTDEQIDLVRPADGTYTMIVHGWAVGATPVAYDLRSWLVPATTGGSLSVVSGSPQNVAVGDKVDVVVGWSGLTAGVEYLGSVTHRIGGTIEADTVVAVNP